MALKYFFKGERIIFCFALDKFQKCFMNKNKQFLILFYKLCNYTEVNNLALDIISKLWKSSDIFLVYRFLL